MRYSVWIWLTLAFCFFVITHQVFWCPIHGDGAFYALLMKSFAQNPTLTLFRASGQPFFDHPYLFFWCSWPFVKIFGFSDFAIKLPNFIAAGWTLWLLTRLSQKTYSDVDTQEDCSQQQCALWAGLVGCIILLLSGLYEHQVRQPSLDPLAHLIALSAVFVWFRNRSVFLSGLILGFAFLTKGLEMLPYLGALMVTGLLDSSIRKPRKTIYISALKMLSFAAGVLVIVGFWAALDASFGIGWFKGYYQYQFANRFFTQGNFAKKTFDVSYLKTLLEMYQPWFTLSLGISIAYLFKNKRLPLLWLFNWIYIFLVTLAFCLIKKDSLQHFTGIYILNSLILGQSLLWVWQKMKTSAQERTLKFSRYFLIFIAGVGLIGSLYFWFTPYNKKDIWQATRSLQLELAQSSRTLIVIDPDSPWQEQIFWNAKWYWKNPIFWSPIDRREQVTRDQEIILVRANAEGTALQIEKKLADEELLKKLGI